MKRGDNAINDPERMMGKRSHLRIPFALAAVLCLGAAPAAFGCAFHAVREVQLGGMYPGSLSVAVALRRAADSGVIDAAALEAPSARGALYIDSVRRLHEFRKAITASPAAAELPSRFSLGYVESQLWSRYSHADGKIRAHIHTDGPAEGEAVVLTGEPVLTEMLAGRLSVERALADGMVLIDGDEIEQTAISRALGAASSANRIGSRQIHELPWPPKTQKE